MTKSLWILLTTLSNLFVLISLTSCSELTENEVTDDIVFSANSYLSDGDCQKAIDLLEAYGRKPKHAGYISTLASAYACRASFSEPVFYADNLPNIGASVGTTFLSPLVRFTSSQMIGPSDASFADLQTAIDIILYSGDIASPSHVNRVVVFGEGEANDLNMQLLYMLLTQMGKYAFYYGNANPTNGTKGNGSSLNGNPNNNSNECFITYTQTNIVNLIQGLPYVGACIDTATDDGHPQLSPNSVSIDVFVKRSCQGLVLFNNFTDVILNLELPSSFGNIGTLKTDVSTFFNLLCGTTLSAMGADGTLLCQTRSQAECETNWGNNTNATPNSTAGSNALQIYLGTVWEGLFQN